MYAKTITLMCVALTLVASTVAFGSEQAAIDEQVMFGLKEAQRILANENLKEFGMEDSAELAQLKVGVPIPAYRLDPAALDKYTHGQALGTLLTPMEELYFPVSAKGETRFVLWLAKLEGRWQFAGFGQADLAPALTGLIARYSVSGASMKIVLQPQTHARMALVEHAGQEKLFYISSSPWSFDNAIRDDLVELSQPEMMAQLQQAVRVVLTPGE